MPAALQLLVRSSPLVSPRPHKTARTCRRARSEKPGIDSDARCSACSPAVRPAARACSGEPVDPLGSLGIRGMHGLVRGTWLRML